ncbi:ATP-binding protein [Streptomyces sp. NPDC005355]|uniref:ATP-binding protein n=1 Tax=Streptomyces sp. NPDC005355 TaxID=3157038 RepID=UPI0033A2B545
MEVSDPREGRPGIAEATPDDESGRGLAIVDALAEAWGVRERIVGKTVWARVGLQQLTLGWRQGAESERSTARLNAGGSADVADHHG